MESKEFNEKVDLLWPSGHKNRGGRKDEKNL